MFLLPATDKSNLFSPFFPVAEKITGPRDLVISEVSYNSVRLTWAPATGAVVSYRIAINPYTLDGQLISAEERQVSVVAVELLNVTVVVFEEEEKKRKSGPIL